MSLSASFYPKKLIIQNKTMSCTSTHFNPQTNLTFNKINSVKNSRKVSHQKKLNSQRLNEVSFGKIIKSTLNSPIINSNKTFLTESHFFPPNNTKKKTKSITTGRIKASVKNRTKSVFSKSLIPHKESKKVIIKKIQVTRKLKKIKKCSRNSSCTTSTNTSDKLKKNNNILSPKFLEAQNKWRNNFGATIIQKIFRGFYFRKYNFKKQIIYRKKKVKNSRGILNRRNKFNYNLRMNRLNDYNNYFKIYQTFSNDFIDNGIRTIIIESFNKSKYTNNNSQNSFNINEM